MPGNILSADSNFPNLSAEQSDSEKINVIQNYLYMLLEQLRYTMANLGVENFNETELDGLVKTITDPVYLRIQDAEKNITSIQAQAQGLTVRVQDAEGNVTALQQQAQGLTTRVQNAEGAVSTLTQTVNGMRLQVTNGENKSSISLTANGAVISSQTIRFNGMVTFQDLEDSGTTIINGDNITTGTISAMDIDGCYITGSIFQSVLSSAGRVGGEIEMCYRSDTVVAGGIRLDDMGAGTSTERSHRMFIYTESAYGIDFALKLQAASGMSLDAAENVAILAGTVVTIDAPRVNIIGDLYVNGTPYTA